METVVTTYPRQRRASKKRKWLPWVLFVVFIIIAAIPGVKWYLDALPNDTQIKPHPDFEVPIIFKGDYLNASALMVEGEIYLPLEVIQSTFDPNMIWDSESASVIVTTENRVMQFPSDQLTALINQKPFTLRMPVKKIKDTVFVPIDPLKHLYPVAVTEAGGVVEISLFDMPKQKGIISLDEKTKEEGTYVRAGNSIKEPYYVSLKEGEVTVVGEESGWYRIQTADNIIGYVQKKHIQLTDIAINKYESPAKSFIPWKPTGNKINLTWEHVHSVTPKTSTLPQMDGINVVSPTWFEIVDNNGTVHNKADKQYVDWAHAKGYQVWALFSNGFDPDRTKEVLKSFETRQHIINQVVSYAKLYDVDGINIDFENIYLEQKEAVVQFMRELTPYLHELNMVVSADVTVKSNSETWSMFYDRKRIGEVVDYMMIMTYDEHWATSPIAGSVASLPWTERGLQGVLQDVPAHKLLLGVPFYTRIWEEVKQDNGQVKVSSKAVGMDRVQQIIKEKKLTPVLDATSGQNFVQYEENGNTYKIWIEDELSMQRRIGLIKKYNLAGIASWQRAFASKSIWPAIKTELEKKLNE